MRKILATWLFITIIACTDKHAPAINKIAISIVADTTDILSSPALIEADPVLRLCQLDSKPNTEVFFRFRVIKNVKLVPVVNYHLPAPGSVSDDKDPQARNKEIVQFYGQIRSTINAFRAASIKGKELPNSECFFSIVEELNHLAKNNYYSSILIVCSNLFEKSFIDVYKQKFSSDDLYRLFEKAYPLPQRLDRIKIFFVFNPTNRDEDERYETIVSAYRKLLERRGAIVTVQATSNFYEL